MGHERFPIRTGTLTLLLTVVTLCLAVLSVLSAVTARADLALAQKGARQLDQSLAADALGQQWLAQLDEALQTSGALPAPAVRQPNGGIAAQLDCGESGLLQIEVAVNGQSWRVTRWQLERSWQPDTGLDLWQGPAA